MKYTFTSVISVSVSQCFVLLAYCFKNLVQINCCLKKKKKRERIHALLKMSTPIKPALQNNDVHLIFPSLIRLV